MARPRKREAAGNARSEYTETAPGDFGAKFAHRLRWAHAVNSRKRLQRGLESAVQFLEADVSLGPLTSSQEEYPLVCTANNEPVIMAHYPTERCSDLSLSCFIHTVLNHNDEVARRAEMLRLACGDEQDVNGLCPGSGQSEESHGCGVSSPAAALPAQRMRSAIDDNYEAFTEDESEAFSADLVRELEERSAPSQQRPVLSCVGVRKGLEGSGDEVGYVRKGIKLDFKRWECVEPAVTYLSKVGAAAKLGGHLWLNADVFAGPGSLMSPLDAQKFVQLCAERMPEAVLSLGWGATILSTKRMYTHDMIARMIELCMIPSIRPTSDGFMCVPPAAACAHITFAVAAEYALTSAENLHLLLSTVPNSSLTIYTGVGSLGITPATVRELIKTFGCQRCFFDLRVSKPWRSWVFGSGKSSDAEVAEQSAATHDGSSIFSQPGPASAAVNNRRSCELHDSSPRTTGELIAVV